MSTADVTTRSSFENPEAEQAVLAGMLIAKDGVLAARGLIQAKHFHATAHAKIFDAILAVDKRGEAADLITVGAELTARGELELVGGPVKLASLLDYAATTANLKHHAKLVRERSVRTAARDQARALIESAKDPTRPIDEVIQLHRKQMRAITEDHGAIERRAWMEQILTLRDTLETEFPVIESIIGNGILTRGSYGLFAGHSGLGKTYLTIQMMAAILAGEPFLGQPTHPCRVAMLEFEMPWQAMKARAMRFGGDLATYGLGADLLCMPKGRWYFTDDDVISRIVDWCDERAVKLLIVDPMNRIRQGDASDPEVAAALMDSIHEIVERTGVTILCVSHVRKTPSMGRSGAKTSTSSLDSIKGDSRYVDDADTAFILDEVLDGNERLISFEWAKSRFGEKPATVYLRRNHTGFFDQVESPTAKREAENETVEQVLKAAGTNGVRVAQIESQFKVPQEKARRMLVRVGGVPRGSTRDRKYYHPEVLEDLEPELPIAEAQE